MARCGSLSANECYQYDGCMYSARTNRCKKDPLHAGRQSTKRTYKKRKTATKGRKACPLGSRRNISTGRCRQIKSARKSTKKRTYKKRRSTRKSTKKRRTRKRKSTKKRTYKKRKSTKKRKPNVYRPRTTTARCPSIKGRQSCASALNCIWYGKKCHTL